MDLVFLIHSDTLCLLSGLFSSFTFTVITERYDISVIVLSQCFCNFFSGDFLCSFLVFVAFGLSFTLKESPLVFLAGLDYGSQAPLDFVCLGSSLSLLLLNDKLPG